MTWIVIHFRRKVNLVFCATSTRIEFHAYSYSTLWTKNCATYFCEVFDFCWLILTILPPLQSEISAHVSGVKSSTHPRCIATLPVKNCAVNNNISHIVWKKSTEIMSKPVTPNSSYTVTVSELMWTEVNWTFIDILAAKIAEQLNMK